MIEMIRRFCDAVDLKFWDLMRPRVRPNAIPFQPPDTTGGGWGKGFQQSIDDVESLEPASIELLRSQWSSGDQRWSAMIWDGDDEKVPTVEGQGSTPAHAMRDANRKYRVVLLQKGTAVQWSRER